MLGEKQSVNKNLGGKPLSGSSPGSGTSPVCLKILRRVCVAEAGAEGEVRGRSLDFFLSVM